MYSSTVAIDVVAAALARRATVLGKNDFTSMLRRQPRIEDKILSTVSERMRYR